MAENSASSIYDIYTILTLMHHERNANIREWRRQAFADRFDIEPAIEGGSNIRIPLTRWIVDIIHDRLVLSQFGVSTPLYRVRAVSIDDTDIAEKLTRALHRFVENKEAIEMAIYDALLLGCGVVRLMWKESEKRWGRRIKRRSVFTEWVPLENIMLAEPHGDLYNQSAVAHIFYKHKDDILKAMEADGGEGWAEDAKEHIEKAEFGFGDDFAYLYDNDATMPNDVQTMIKVAEIFYWKDGQYYHSWYLPQSGAVLFDRPYISPTDGLPFFYLRFYENGYGYGLAPLLEPLEKEITALHNQRIDNNTLKNMPIFKVMTTSPAMRDREEWYAGRKIPVDNPDDITPLVIPETVTTLSDEQYLMDIAKLVTGVSEILSGNPLRGEKTAYEVEATLAEGSVRFRRYVIKVGEWIKKQAEYALLLMKVYGNSADFVRVIGINPFDALDYEDLLNRFEIVYNSILTNKELERQRWVLLRNLLVQEPLVAQNQKAWWEVLRQMLIAFDVDYQAIIGTSADANAQLIGQLQQGQMAIQALNELQQQMMQAQQIPSVGGQIE